MGKKSLPIPETLVNPPLLNHPQKANLKLVRLAALSHNALNIDHPY